MEDQSNQNHDLLIGEIGLLGQGSVGDGAGILFFSCESQIATALLLF